MTLRQPKQIKGFPLSPKFVIKFIDVPHGLLQVNLKQQSARVALSEYESARIPFSEYGTKQCVEIFAYLIEGVYYVTFCCDRFIRQR